ncbi:MAG: hypothetical protein QOH97_1890, partial [Actinoplanes sp.]|nr:hypothetical protein [Actinoplanes sp.]
MTTLGSLARRSMGTGALWMVGLSASSPMTVLVGGDTQV